jgi:putative transposase
MGNSHSRYELLPGSEVVWRDRRVKIVQVLDMSTALVQESKDRPIESVPLHELAPTPRAVTLVAPIDLSQIPDDDWEVARRRFEAIKPLIGIPHRTRAMVVARGKEVHAETTSLYRWLRAWEEGETLASLLRQRRSDRGSKRVNEHSEAIIKAVIESHFLKGQRFAPIDVVTEVHRQCRLGKVDLPHANTIRNRLSQLSERLVTSRRLGKRAARRLDPKPGTFPNGDYPLQTVLIDHTKADIILVDDVHRLPIGRPTLTVVIDACSRMILGFFISLEPPSALAAGMALSHAILPKEQWMAKRGIEGTWPCWGKPKAIHLDNAKEFRGKALTKACAQHGISIEYRRPLVPEWGGIVERVIGTLMAKTHRLPGTTFSNPTERGKYDSDGNATFTLGEFERWLATYIIGVYNVGFHEGLQTTPLHRWTQGILGSAEQSGVGLPEKFVDEDRVQIDFLPLIERSVQSYGVQYDCIHYYADVLRPWVHAKDADNAKTKRLFAFRYDPRDMSHLYFWDPELETYFDVPYRDRSLPAISLWELREIRKRLRAEGMKQVDEGAIFRALAKLRVIEEAAAKTTRSIRRHQQRRKGADDAVKPKLVEMVAADAPEPEAKALPKRIIKPFSDLTEL